MILVSSVELEIRYYSLRHTHKHTNNNNNNNFLYRCTKLVHFIEFNLPYLETNVGDLPENPNQKKKTVNADKIHSHIHKLSFFYYYYLLFQIENVRTFNKMIQIINIDQSSFS